MKSNAMSKFISLQTETEGRECGVGFVVDWAMVRFIHVSPFMILV